MSIYWLLYLSVVLLAFQERVFSHKDIKSLLNIPVAWIFIPFFIFILIGFRFEVGGDWGAYLRYYDRIKGVSFYELWFISDPGYQLLNYIAYNLGGGIYTVNLMCGTIFSVGLMVFCSKLPRPMLSLVTAIPYMVIVLAMGYSRQACALGFIFLALNALIHKSILRFSFWVVIATLFHKSAIVLMPVAALLNSKNRIISFLWVILAAVLSYITLLKDSVDGFYTTYVETEAQSQGALVRVLMCLVPSLIFLIFKKRFNMSIKEKQIWICFSVASIVAFLLLIVASASTAIDRIALYLLPIQLVIFSYIPEIFGNTKRNNNQWIAIICIYYAVVLFVWLMFSANRSVWVPYKFYPFTLL